MQHPTLITFSRTTCTTQTWPQNVQGKNVYLPCPTFSIEMLSLPSTLTHKHNIALPRPSDICLAKYPLQCTHEWKVIIRMVYIYLTASALVTSWINEMMWLAEYPWARYSTPWARCNSVLFVWVLASGIHWQRYAAPLCHTYAGVSPASRSCYGYTRAMPAGILEIMHFENTCFVEKLISVK